MRFLYTDTGKTTPIYFIIFRETSLSRYYRGLIEGPLKPIGPSQLYCIERLKGGRESTICRKAIRLIGVVFFSMVIYKDRILRYLPSELRVKWLQFQTVLFGKTHGIQSRLQYICQLSNIL